MADINQEELAMYKEMGLDQIYMEEMQKQKDARIQGTAAKLEESKKAPTERTEEAQMAKLMPSGEKSYDMSMAPKGIVNGAIKAVGDSANAIIEGADWVENLAAKVGIGSGDLLSDSSKIDWSNKLGLPQNDPDVQIGQHVGQIGSVLAASYGAGALSGSKAVAYGTEAALSYMLTDPDGENFASLARDKMFNLRKGTALYSAMSALAPTHEATTPEDKSSERMKNRFKGMLEGLGIRAMSDAVLWGANRYATNKNNIKAVESFETGRPVETQAAEVVSEASPTTAAVPPAIAREIDPVVEMQLVDILHNELNFTKLPPKPDAVLEAGAKTLIATPEARSAFINKLRNWNPESRVGIGAEEVVALRSLIVGNANDAVLEASKKLALDPRNEEAAFELADSITRKASLENSLGAFEQPVGQELRSNQLVEPAVAGRSMMQSQVSRNAKADYEISKEASTLNKRAQKIYKKELTKLSGGQDKLVAIANANKIISELPDSDFYKIGQEIIVRSGPERAANELSRMAINGLLKFSTATTAAVGNTLALAKRSTDNYVSALYAKGFKGNGRTIEESNAFLHGVFSSIGEGTSSAWNALKTGKEAGPISDLTRVAYNQDPLSKRLGIFGSDNVFVKMLAKMTDATGIASEAPTRALLSQDTLFATMNFRAAQHMEAARLGVSVDDYAKSIAGKAAAEAQAADARWYVFNAKFDEMKNKTIGNIGAAGQRFLESTGGVAGPMANALFPFLRATANGIDIAVEQNPFSALIKAAGAAPKSVERYDHLARATTSGALLGGMMYMMHNKYLTRDTDYTKKTAFDRGNTTGPLPFALQFGDTQVSLQKLDPMKQLAYTSQLLLDASSYMKEEQYGQLADATLSAITKTFTPHMLMDSFGRFTEAMSDASKVGGGVALEKLAADYASRFIPASGILEDISEMNDSYKLSTQAYSGFLDRLERTVRSKMPGMSEDVPADLNIFAEPIRRGNGMFDLINPFQVSVQDEGTEFENKLKELNQIYEELRPLNPDIENIGMLQMPPAKIRFPTGIDVPLDAKEYLKYVEYSAGTRDFKTGKHIKGDGFLKAEYKKALANEKLFSQRTIIEYNLAVDIVGGLFSSLRAMAGEAMLKEPSVMMKHDKILKRLQGAKK